MLFGNERHRMHGFGPEAVPGHVPELLATVIVAAAEQSDIKGCVFAEGVIPPRSRGFEPSSHIAEPAAHQRQFGGTGLRTQFFSALRR